MKYVKFTYRENNQFPDVAGLVFELAFESQYPTSKPVFLGTCPDDSNTETPGVLGEFCQADYEQMKVDELAARPRLKTLLEVMEDGVESRLDDFAKTRGYKDILSACSYATSAIEAYRVEGLAAVRARDTTWAGFYALSKEVEAGLLVMPMDFAGLAPLLPELSWGV